MRETAKWTAAIGFLFSIIATAILSRLGTSHETLTTTLYMYGLVCLIGGFIGYRNAFLKYGKNIEEARLRDVIGLKKLKKTLKPPRWVLKTEKMERKVDGFRLNEKLISVRDGENFRVSYPRKAVKELYPA